MVVFIWRRVSVMLLQIHVFVYFGIKKFIAETVGMVSSRLKLGNNKLPTVCRVKVKTFHKLCIFNRVVPAQKKLLVKKLVIVVLHKQAVDVVMLQFLFPRSMYL